MKRRLAVALTLATIFLTTALCPPTALAVGGRAYPHLGEKAGAHDTSWRVGVTDNRPATFAVGDSILAGVYRKRLRTSQPAWEVSAVPGRNVCNLPWYLQDRLDSLRELMSLRRVIIALGTNACEDWTRADLAKAIAIIPDHVEVILVTTYRSPAKYGASRPFRSRASVQASYTSWMKQIASTRPNTRLMQWRAIVQRNRTLLGDGVHPNAGGIKRYVRALTKVATRS